MLTNPTTFVVFDLDDTLYQEREYQYSGFLAVAKFCSEIYRIDVLGDMLNWYSEGDKDIFARLCSQLSIPESCKGSFLWIYRNHAPDIHLTMSTALTLRQLRRWTNGLAILTDGRSVTQRQKIKALGLSDLPVYISEEWGETKPGERRFHAIQSQHSADEYWYVGDNPVKDFLTPNQLGWRTICLRDKGGNIHSQEAGKLTAQHLPNYWVDEISEIMSFFE